MKIYAFRKCCFKYAIRRQLTFFLYFNVNNDHCYNTVGLPEYTLYESSPQYHQ